VRFVRLVDALGRRTQTEVGATAFARRQNCHDDICVGISTMRRLLLKLFAVTRSLQLVSFFVSCALLPSAAAQSCGAQGVALQVLGSGGPELQDQRASSSYLVWDDGRARVLVDAGGGSALRFAESGGANGAA
jgi:hypothetical protein